MTKTPKLFVIHRSALFSFTVSKRICHTADFHRLPPPLHKMFCFGLGSAFGESRNERNFTRAKALVQGIGPTLAATVNLFMCVRSARNWELFSFLRKPVERWMCALRTWAFTWNEWFDLRYGPTSVIRARLHTILAILLNKNERTEDLCAQEFNRDKNLTQFFTSVGLRCTQQQQSLAGNFAKPEFAMQFNSNHHRNASRPIHNHPKEKTLIF